jgi:hypothetical protein
MGSTYDIDTDAGDATLLQPKSTPDLVTDSTGSVYIDLPAGSFINTVIKYGGHVATRTFKNNTQQTQASPNFVMTRTKGADGNVEYFGHNLHEDAFPQGGLKTDADTVVGLKDAYKLNQGDFLDMRVKGNNISANPSDGTFEIYRDLPGPPATDPLAYAGSILNPAETLSLAAGTMGHKVITWYVDPAIITAFGNGKYRSEVTWDEGGIKKNHVLGIFFVEPDITAPAVTGDTAVTTYTNAAVNILYSSNPDTAQSGTVRATFLDIASVADNDQVYVDKDITVDSGVYAAGGPVGNPAFNADFFSASSPFSLPAYGEILAPAANVGNNAKDYTVRLWKMDPSGNIGSKDVAVKACLTKAEADILANPIYDLHLAGPINDPFNFFTDYSILNYHSHGFNVLANKLNTTYNVGHDYDNQSVLSAADMTHLDDHITTNDVLPHVKPIPRGTKVEFETNLNNFLNYERDFHGHVP